MTLTLKQGIRVIQSSLGIKLSPEQLAILSYDHRGPIMVDACAGSGKTTLYLIDGTNLILIHKAKPKQILGITFSKRAQLDMGRRYDTIRRQLAQRGYYISGRPRFVTFHALFYRLLKHLHQFDNDKVLSSWKQVKYQLFRAMKIYPQNRTKSEELDDIFRLRGCVVNHDYSYDGVTFGRIRSRSRIISKLSKIASDNYMNRQESFFENYLSVVKAYIRIKRKNNWIDFNDMKTLLYQAIQKKHDRKIIKGVMNKFKYAYIDEFQDIDPLQWRLIRQILNKEALGNLMVIGDDDQSIYAFRGGDPDIMLNYKDYVPNAKIMHLSTNYRTGGNILSSVAPLIKLNKYRYKKRLLAYKKGQGHLIEFHDDRQNKLTAGEQMFSDLWRKIRNPRIDNSKIAILVRYNSDRMFAINWLANHMHFINAGATKNILQNNYIYQIFYNLYKAFAENLFKPFEDNATRIGFNKYKKHVVAVANSYPVHNLSDFTQAAMKYDTKKKLFKTHSPVVMVDLKVRKILRDYHNKSFNASQRSVGLWKALMNLTNYYFKWMRNSEYMSGVMINDVRTTVTQEVKQTKNAPKFLELEEDKLSVLKNPKLARKITPHPIHILSLHQSKGLQFQYVYLYGLTDRDVKPYKVAEDNYFAPNISKPNFLYKLCDLDAGQIKHIENPKNENAYIILQKEFLMTLGKNLKNCTDVNKRRAIVQKIIKDITTGHLLVKQQSRIQGLNCQKIFDKLYATACKDARFVEEERRLVYVGVTRAERATFISVASNASPLLKEIQIKGGLNQ